MTLSHLKDCQTLLEPLDLIPSERPFVTMWRPDRTPEYETLSFGRFTDLARKSATLLLEAGIDPGQTVLLIQPQGVPLMASFVGALMIGAIPSILAYPNFKVDPGKYRSGLAGVTRNVSARLTVVDAGFPEPLMTLVSSQSVLRLDDRRLRATPALSSLHRPDPADVAFLQHSAGTTGLQKGVALSHRRVLRQVRKLAEALELTPRDAIASWLPLYHDMGLIACLILPLTAGLHVAMESPVDWVMQPASFLRLIQRFGCTLAWLPNFAFQFLARKVPDEQREGLDLAGMRAFVSCSEPIRAQSLDEFQAAFQPHGLRSDALQTSYAMAENVFAATQSRPAVEPRRIHVNRDRLRREGVVESISPDHPKALVLVSSGRSLPDTLVFAADERGAPLPADRVGELVLESDCLFEGYFNRPDLTRRALREGRYHTGDRGFVNDGEVYVLGRIDDVIIIAGRNIDPQDVEEIAHGHPDVSDGRAVAFGLENPELGTQDLHVVAEARFSQATAERQRIALEIRGMIAAQLDLSPRAVHIVPPRWLIKSTAGKPARSANREKLLRRLAAGIADASGGPEEKPR